MRSNLTALVVGGGVIGGAIALELLNSGMDVTLLDKGRFAGESSTAAAGLLGIQAEMFDASFPQDMLQESLRVHRQWSEQLERMSQISIHYHKSGILRAAFSEEEALQFQTRMRQTEGQVDWLDHKQVQMKESRINANNFGGVYFPEDAFFQPLQLMRALHKCLIQKGCTILEWTPALSLVTRQSEVIGVRTVQDEMYADLTVVASGAWTNALLAPFETALSVIPSKGQAYSVLTSEPQLSCVVQGHGLYVIPRLDGTTIVGATREEGNYDKSPTVSALAELQNRVEQLLPCFHYAKFESTWVGIRPASSDGYPYIGQLRGIDGLYVAAGHGSSGMILSPVTAKTIVSMIIGNKAPVDPTPFDPNRKMEVAG